MYLIIEKSDTLYAYFESNKHFKEMEKQRDNLHKLDAAALHDECDLLLQADKHGPFRIAILVKENLTQKRRKQRNE